MKSSINAKVPNMLGDERMSYKDAYNHATSIIAEQARTIDELRKYIKHLLEESQ
jgi:hypothetical protein